MPPPCPLPPPPQLPSRRLRARVCVSPVCRHILPGGRWGEAHFRGHGEDKARRHHKQSPEHSTATAVCVTWRAPAWKGRMTTTSCTVNGGGQCLDHGSHGAQARHGERGHIKTMWPTSQETASRTLGWPTDLQSWPPPDAASWRTGWTLPINAGFISSCSSSNSSFSTKNNFLLCCCSVYKGKWPVALSAGKPGTSFGVGDGWGGGGRTLCHGIRTTLGHDICRVTASGQPSVTASGQPLCHGIRTTQCHGTRTTQCHGIRTTQCPGTRTTTVSWHQNNHCVGIRTTLGHGTRTTHYHGIRTTQCHGIRTTQCHGIRTTTVSWHQDNHCLTAPGQPLCHGIRTTTVSWNQDNHRVTASGQPNVTASGQPLCPDIRTTTVSWNQDNHCVMESGQPPCHGIRTTQCHGIRTTTVSWHQDNHCVSTPLRGIFKKKRAIKS